MVSPARTAGRINAGTESGPAVSVSSSAGPPDFSFRSRESSGSFPCSLINLLEPRGSSRSLGRSLIQEEEDLVAGEDQIAVPQGANLDLAFRLLEGGAVMRIQILQHAFGALGADNQ